MADNDIIDFYKKADTDSKSEEPLKEQVETPEPVVFKAVAVPVPESNDPFDKFLFNLAEKLKTEKKITEQQQQQFNERVVKPTTNPEDPFAKFLESFAGLVKEDENINKDENIKEATIDFINKLKDDDFFDRDIPKIIPKVKSKSKKYLPPKFAKKIETVEEELPVIEQSTESETEVKQPEPSNPYLKELQTADKKKNKIEDKISGLSDIKKIIAQQVQEQLSKYPNIGFTGGGGGTNAVQYALGGTMDGDLNVTGKYLSGGVDISTLFGSGGGAVSGIPDRLIAGSETLRLYSNGTIDFPNDTIRPPDETILTLESENPLLSSYTRVALSPYAFFAYDNEGNSITFDEVDNAIVLTSKDQYEWTFNQQGVLAGPNGHLTVNALSSLGRILSGGKDLLEIFALSGTGGGGGTGRDDVNTIVISNSANWNTAYNTATAYQSVSSSFVTEAFLSSNYVHLSGDTMSGGLTATNFKAPIYYGTDGNDDGGYTGGPGGYIDLRGGDGSVDLGAYGGPAGSIDLRGSSQDEGVYSGGSINLNAGTGGGGSITSMGASENSGGNLDMSGGATGPGGSIDTSNDGGNINTSNEGGSIYTSDGGGSIDTRGTGSIELGYFATKTTFTGTATVSRSINLPDADGTVALESYVNTNFLPLSVSNLEQWNTAYNTTTALQSISGNYLSLSGGTVTGDVTITGNLTALGTTLFQNTVFTTASTLSVINTGPGPALYVYQSSGPYDVASFYDGDGIEVLHVGNANPNGLGRVGINESFPNLELTVRGSVSATGTIFASAINISTSILSAGVNLLDIFTDDQTLYYTESSARLSISNGNTVSLSAINSTFAANSGKYESVYTNIQSNSSNWQATYTNVQTNSANWNNAYNTATVYQSNSASYATTAYTDSAYLHVSGGTLTGNLSVYGNTFINNNLTIGGNLTALGTTTFANTIFTTTSSLSVVNTGTGPALYVFQAAGPYDVASFYDGDGIEVLHVGNAGPGGFGKVGVNESFPNEELTVRGSISATSTIYANSYLSAGVNLLDIFSGGGGGGGATPIKRFDYVTVSNIDYSYSGSAAFGTLDTSPTWKLIRLTYANNGTISNSASAIDSWTGRLTATYV